MRSLLILFSLTLLLTSCTQKEVHREYIMQVPKTTEGEFVHAVYFWLKSPDDPTKNQAFVTSLEKFLKACPDIRTYHLGQHAGTDRPIIDQSYTYALVVTFDSKAAQDAYQEHPAHKLFIKESEALWERVQIYDSINVLK